MRLTPKERHGDRFTACSSVKHQHDEPTVFEFSSKISQAGFSRVEEPKLGPAPTCVVHPLVDTSREHVDHHGDVRTDYLGKP